MGQDGTFGKGRTWHIGQGATQWPIGKSRTKTVVFPSRASRLAGGRWGKTSRFRGLQRSAFTRNKCGTSAKHFFGTWMVSVGHRSHMKGVFFGGRRVSTSSWCPLLVASKGLDWFDCDWLAQNS
jgi:hypothetical protein